VNGTTVALELKYKTRRFDASVGDERFALAEHGAHTDNRVRFIEDIQRLQRVVAGFPQSRGYFVLLTNDDRYWKWPSLSVPSGAYTLNWCTYAMLPAQFRYALIPVTSPNER
jgi:hypothetical protein